jgi:hypothetical protein
MSDLVEISPLSKYSGAMYPLRYGEWMFHVVMWINDSAKGSYQWTKHLLVTVLPPTITLVWPAQIDGWRIRLYCPYRTCSH